MAFIFSACVELVLAREPFELLSVTEVRQQVEAAELIELTRDTVDDYGRTPENAGLLIESDLEVARQHKRVQVAMKNADVSPEIRSFLTGRTWATR